MAMKPAIFLDKDGTILQDVPYNTKPEKMVFAPGAQKGIARLSRFGLPLIVVSNQPGIALGKFGFNALGRMQRRLVQMFEESGARLDGFYYCPHLPTGTRRRYATFCQCRKPAPGLLTRAAERHDIELIGSWMIGDILDDIEAGKRAGCRTILIDNGNETEWNMNEWRCPHYRVLTLDNA
ncbi:MAG TPA: HAD family hydrolase, partial [Pusillimonas sp.]|nr:HAD family hydrolase [Pusillimonas sp.]